MRVGVPRALMFYYYFPLWRAFIEALGGKVVVSPPSNKEILDKGMAAVVDEACLPVKIYYGHVRWLAGRVDTIFCPRLVSVESKAYICPKLIGLPDMLRANLDLPPLIDDTLDLSRKDMDIERWVFKVGSRFTNRRTLIKEAWQKACDVYGLYRKLVCEGMLPPEAMRIIFRDANPERSHHAEKNEVGERKVVVLGHAYNIYDRYATLDIIDKLRRMQIKVVTADNLPVALVNQESLRLPKRLFWTLGKRQMGAVYHYMTDKEVSGIIYVASFGCGPDSLVGELVERRIRQLSNLPFMTITIDEHSGEAGLDTRLEAFLDMLPGEGTA